MIPFQTILALLAVLLMFGCSQEAPPKLNLGQAYTAQTTGATTTGNQQTVKPRPSPGGETNTIQGKGPDGKSDTKLPVSPESSALQIEASDPSSLVLRLTGLDAYRLFLATEIAPRLEKTGGSLDGSADEEGAARAYIKTGRHYQCKQDMLGDYECLIKIAKVDGAIPQLEDPKKIKAKPARLVPATDLQGVYLFFFANPNAEGKPYPYFQVQLYRGYAQTIHSALSVGEIEGRKKGKQVDCSRDPKQAVTDNQSYKCIFYGTLSDGHFDDIN